MRRIDRKANYVTIISFFFCESILRYIRQGYFFCEILTHRHINIDNIDIPAVCSLAETSSIASFCGLGFSKK